MFLQNMSGLNARQGLHLVLSKIEKACSKRSKELPDIKPRVVAASKTKPVEAIIEAYNEGQRDFGENYVQELEEKAHNELILENCKDIKWHFIGHLQGNKVNKVISIPNLYIVESIDSKKIAKKVNSNWPQFGNSESKIRIFVQVNTSGEEAKSGVSPDEVVDMVKFVKNECRNLQFLGLMTIGKYDYNPDEGPNPDFLKLLKCREDVCQTFHLSQNEIELSMGMSTDFEQAIELGSTNVRVGTAIFGLRSKKT